MLPTAFKPREIPNFVQCDGAFHSVVRHLDFQEKVRAWGRKSATVSKPKMHKTPDQKCLSSKCGQQLPWSHASHVSCFVLSERFFSSHKIIASHHLLKKSTSSTQFPTVLCHSGRCHLHPDGLREAWRFCRSGPDCSDGPDEPRLCDTVQGTTLCPLVLSAAFDFLLCAFLPNQVTLFSEVLT